MKTQLALCGLGLISWWGVSFAQNQGGPMAAGLRSPVRGEWLVFWGGDTAEQNYHHAAPAQRYALDMVKTKNGSTHRGAGQRNEDYYCWNQPLYAPFDGKVTIAVNGVPDNAPGTMNRQMVYGNVVMIQERPGPVAVLAHLRLNTLRVNAGQRVRVGDLIGYSGNSGNSSEPHLHFHVQSRSGFEQGRGLKPYFRNLKVNDKVQTLYSPVKNDKVVG